MSVLRSAVVNLVGVAGAAIAGFLATAVLARHLETELFGRVSLLLVVVNGIAIFEGMRPVIVFQTQQLNSRWEEIYVVARTITWGTAVIAWILVFMTSMVLDRLRLSVVEALVLASTASMFFPVALYWAFLDAEGQTAFTGGLRGGMWVLSYAAFMVLAVAGASFIAFIAVMCGMNLALCVLYRSRLRGSRRLGGGVPPLAMVRRFYGLALENIGLNFGAVTIGTADRMVIGAQAGYAQLGLYSGPYEFATKPLALVRSVAQVLYPAAVKHSVGGGSIERAWTATVGLSVSLAITGCVIAVLLRDQLVPALLGSAFQGTSDVFGILVMAFWMTVAGYAANIQLNSAGDFRTQRVAYSVAAGVMVIALFPAVTTFGILGAAGTYLAARSVDLVLAVIAARRLNSTLWGTDGLSMLIAIASALWAAWIGNWLVSMSAVCGLWLLNRGHLVFAIRRFGGQHQPESVS